MKTIYSSQDLADILKGGANHHRINILFLLDKRGKLTLDEVAEALRANYKTIAVHLSRLHKSGLVTKRYKASAVEHDLTPRARHILNFLRILE
ncbi:ArsR family transcriptional regulator [Candidatus Saccharibacteria bacterium]|nr:ArsR family transcriptional regulator [Candidatus Saccharibacteria bacterium]